MIPAPPLRWVLLILFPTLSHQTSGTFSVKVQSPASGFLGSSVSLHCALVNNMDARNLEVSWYRPKMQNTPILSYKNTQIQSPVDVQYQRRVFLLGELEKGDVSLKLENLTLADRGEYVCHVSSDNWYDKATVSLTVRVVGSTPVLSLTGAGGGQINVSCQSHGWLPEPSITWTDKEGRDLKHLSKDKFSNSSEGVVDVSSWLIVSPSESEWISCSVGLSDQERKEGRIMLFVPAGVTESWSGYFIVIPILLLLLLLLLCAAGITVYRKKGLIFSKRKGTEYTEGTPSETVPLSNICMESQDQNDAPSIIPHSVVVDIDQPSEQREKTPPAPCPDLNQQKSSEQQNPEEVKETPHVAESREEDPGSCSSSPGFSTAGSTTDKPNFTASISHFKPAAPMSEMEPSGITSNPITAASSSNPTPPITSSNPTPAAPMSDMELSAIISNSTPTTTISETLLSDRPSNHTTAASAANPRLTITSSNPTPAATNSNPTPATTNSNPTPATTNSNPTPAATNSNPTPATTNTKPTPAATPSNPTPAATPSNPTPAASNSNPTPAASNSNPTPAATNSNPTTAATDSNPTTAATPSNPTPAATPSNTTPAATPSNTTPAATPSNPTPAATNSNPTPAATNSNPTPAATNTKPTPAATNSNPTPATTNSKSTPAATNVNAPPAATNTNPTPAATNTKHTTAISEPRLAAIISTPTTSATPSEPRSIATISKPNRTISISNPTSAAIVSNSKSNTSISNPTPAATSLNATPTASNSNYTPAATMSEPKHTATFSESATVPTTSAGQFISVCKHPTNNADQRRINIKQRKRKDRANERESSFDKAEAGEIPAKKKALQTSLSSSTENRKFKRLCTGEAADSEGESDPMNVDESTCSAPEEDTMDHESAEDSHHVPPTEDLDMQCD